MSEARTGSDGGDVAGPLRTTASGRPIAAGGLRRALAGLLVGAAAGVATLVARTADRGR